MEAQECTFKMSGESYVEQHWYYCYTCGLINQKGCCSVCLHVCHKGHDVVYSGKSGFFCDCGAGAGGRAPCQCLKGVSLKEQTGSVDNNGNSRSGTERITKVLQVAEAHWPSGDPLRNAWEAFPFSSLPPGNHKRGSEKRETSLFVDSLKKSMMQKAAASICVLSDDCLSLQYLNKNDILQILQSAIMLVSRLLAWQRHNGNELQEFSSELANLDAPGDVPLELKMLEANSLLRLQRTVRLATLSGKSRGENEPGGHGGTNKHLRILSHFHPLSISEIC